MNKKELDLLDRFASKYKIDCVPSEGKYDFWDFTYEWDARKFYCEMKQRNFTLEEAKRKEELEKLKEHNRKNNNVVAFKEGEDEQENN